MILNWIETLNDRLLTYGLSLSTDESVLQSKKADFNSVLRDVHQMYPHKKVSHMILAMHQYYDVEFIVKLLDEELRMTVKSEQAEENSAFLVKKKRAF
jgi:hypothetical protein